jgi:outer membrane receptor protein involved in Fe transport
MRNIYWKSVLTGTICSVALIAGAVAEQFSIPAEDLKTALSAYMAQSGVTLLISGDALKGVRTHGANGNLSPDDALFQLLKGTGFVARPDSSGLIGIVRNNQALIDQSKLQTASASAPTVFGAALETVTVTSSKVGGDVQNIPISITALSQEQLTATQTAGGPDLVKQVPNMTFTKTNFSGYSIQLRGIGTQAISVTTDPAVAVAFNDVPFIRNHFFEQEFYDVSQVEVLRGPQGTLYGRNATAGVVNLISAKPSDQFEAMASLEIGNYGDRRPEGMINIPIVDDRLDIRIAGEWTKRQGYSFNTLTDSRIDGRDLWSGRVSIGFRPSPNLNTTLVWEHFSESDDRMRTSKQLCETDPTPTVIGGVGIPQSTSNFEAGFTAFLSQGCRPASLYSSQSFEVPNGFSLPYFTAAAFYHLVNGDVDPYAEATQSKNLRVIESALNPSYRAKNDTVEFNGDWTVTPALTFTAQTGFNHDFLWATEDYNRFATSPHIFVPTGSGSQSGIPVYQTLISPEGIFCDPQLGCSDRLVAQDLSDEHAWQLSQEFRLASSFSGPLNFSVGGNYLHYETEENYYVFINTLTAFQAVPAQGNLGVLPPWQAGVSDNHQCLSNYAYTDPSQEGGVLACGYIDPNPIPSLNNQGHNYFLSENPYLLDSYAAFGETYYNVTPDIKLTGGLRWTEDRKHFVDVPSELLVPGYGYPSIGAVNQQWNELTGRAVVNWTPKLSFTDQTLIYGSYSHGYKAGGANPPGAVLLEGVVVNSNGAPEPTANPIHPFTFKPEFIDAFEFGTKNTLLDGALTLNGDVFYYNYENYQISEIVDRTSINLNFDTHVKGAEVEAIYEPIPGLRFNFAGGWEDTALAKGSQAIDLIDRTAGNSNWVLVKPFITQASNCILPAYVIAAQAAIAEDGIENFCVWAYQDHIDPETAKPYIPDPTINERGDPLVGYPGFDPLGVDPNAPAGVNNGLGLPPNNGQGFDKDISGKELPNAPPFTVSFGAQYTLPITQDWAGTLRGDYYWQDYSWARVFNDNPYDRLRGYTNVNLTLIFTNQDGWQVMLYDKNVFNETAITGTFLNSDDTGLTTNVFLTDPKLIGIRVTKNW